MAPSRAMLVRVASILITNQLNTLLALFQLLLCRRRRLHRFLKLIRRYIFLGGRSRSDAFSRVVSGNLPLSGRVASIPRGRRWWVRSRQGQLWWRSVVLETWDDEQWVYHFRMTRQTLLDIAAVLRPHIERHGDNRTVISVPERVAITIWWLSSPLNYRKVATQFGRGVSSVAEIVLEVCLSIEVVLLPIAVGIQDTSRAIQGFADLGFPQCFGAIDGSHMPIRAPHGRGGEFINRKEFYSLVLQGTVDHRGHFIDLELGNTGRSHDAHVFRHSAIFQAMEAGRFLPNSPTVTIQGVEVGPLILGDGAYPLLPWLMKPYGGVLSPEQLAYNRVFNRCRNVVERAFGRLKARWACLSAPLTVHEDKLVTIISACVVLHNICEDGGVVPSPEENRPREIEIPNRPEGEALRRHQDQQKRKGVIIRDAIASYIFENC